MDQNSCWHGELSPWVALDKWWGKWKNSEWLPKAKGNISSCISVRETGREKGIGFQALRFQWCFVYTAPITVTTPWRTWAYKNWCSMDNKWKPLRRRLLPSSQVVFGSPTVWITCPLLVNALTLPDDRKHPHYKWETGLKFQKIKLWGFVNASVVSNMELCKFRLIRRIC